MTRMSESYDYPFSHVPPTEFHRVLTLTSLLCLHKLGNKLLSLREHNMPFWIHCSLFLFTFVILGTDEFAADGLSTDILAVDDVSVPVSRHLFQFSAINHSKRKRSSASCSSGGRNLSTRAIAGSSYPNCRQLETFICSRRQSKVLLSFGTLYFSSSPVGIDSAVTMEM